MGVHLVDVGLCGDRVERAALCEVRTLFERPGRPGAPGVRTCPAGIRTNGLLYLVDPSPSASYCSLLPRHSSRTLQDIPSLAAPQASGRNLLPSYLAVSSLARALALSGKHLSLNSNLYLALALTIILVLVLVLVGRLLLGLFLGVIRVRILILVLVPVLKLVAIR